MQNERRRQFRVDSPKDEILVAISTSPEPQIPAEIDNLSVSGMGLYLNRELDPQYDRGETLYLHITSPRLNAPLVVPALGLFTRRC